MQPIIVNKLHDGRLICIEGNTRLFIYRALVAEEVPGNWTKIPALVHESLAQIDVDAIRLQAHLVGPRPWDAYSKAKYLWELQNKEKMPIDRIIALCGGNKRDVTQAIQAYAEMETYYRPICDADDYDTEKYSGFVELQKSSRIKDSILKAGFSLKDFAHWLRNKNIRNLADTRQLARILSDKKAREVFLKKDIKAALDVLEKPELTVGLKGATIGQLARALTEAVDSLSYAEINRLRENPDDDTVRYINDAFDSLTKLVTDLSK